MNFIILINVLLLIMSSCMGDSNLRKSNVKHFETKTPIYLFEGTWTIENFLDLPYDDSEFLECPPISSYNIRSHLQFSLKVLPGKKNNGTVRTYLFLKVLPSGIKKVYTSFDVSILDNTGQMVWTKSKNVMFDRVVAMDVVTGRFEFISVPELIELKDTLLPEGHLNLKFRVNATVKEKNTVDAGNSPPLSCSNNQLALDSLRHLNLLNNDSCSDVVLIASGREFQCHKNILSDRSPVFKALLESSDNGTIDLSHEMNDSELSDLLKYLYFGEPVNLESTCDALYSIAKKHELMELVQKCEDILIKGLIQRTKDPFELLTFGRELGSSKIIRAAATFIANM